MVQKDPNAVTFQVTVARLSLLSQLTRGDIRVTISVGDVSKITCSGDISEDGLTVTWNHPFLFTGSPSTSVGIAISTLPKKLTPSWDKQLLGDQMVTDVASLLKSGKRWKRSVPGLSIGHANLVMKCKTTHVLTTPDKHNCVSTLSAFESKLASSGKHFQSVPCVSTRIELGQAMLDLCSLDHEDHSTIFGSLGDALESRYHQVGNISDLNRALEIWQALLDLSPFGNSQHPYALGDLAVSLWKYYCIQKNVEDLNRLVELEKGWLELCPPDHPDHTRALSELALSLWEHYNVQKDMVDLDKSIEMGERLLLLQPAGHVNHGLALNNLALFIYTRYEIQDNLADLNRAIDLQEMCLQLQSPGHPKHGLALQNLGDFLLKHYHIVEDHSDLTRAVQLFKDALATYPVQHSNFAYNAGQLAEATILLFQFTSPLQPSILEEAFEAYRQLKRCSPAVSFNLLRATQNWIQDAEEYDHSSALEAYQTSLNTLDHFTSFTSSLGSRHEVMQDKVADLANDAFSCATRNNSCKLAVELLEQGRGILWNQLARFDISISALESRGPEERELGKKFARLSTHLRRYAEGNDSQGAVAPYWEVQKEWESVVDEIRGLDGFSRFLLPPLFEDLQRAAEYGPVVVVNASQYNCDAIIVLRSGLPVHVPLPCSLDDVIQLCSQLSELTQDVHAYGTHRESWVKQMLRDLWSSVVEPIITVLRNDIQLSLGSRIWWCPTSKLTILPLHAAGPYRRGEKNLMDIYVSSYAPSLSALIRTCDRIRSQRIAHENSGTQNRISFAAVGQGRPSADTKLGELPEVEREIRRIRDETEVPADVTFDVVTGDEATIEGAVQAFRDHRLVHVACHGAQHAERPFESWFAMGNGKLTLMRIIQERYTNSEFAFLSACHTAVGDESTPDEVLHLAGGMQFAGFNGVIGTLWRVDDAEAHRVVTRFYKEMFKRPVVSFEHAAAALNTAVVESADEVALEKRIVFVHIGI